MTSSTRVSASVNTPSSMSRWAAPRSGSRGRRVATRRCRPLSTHASSQRSRPNGARVRRASGRAVAASSGATRARLRGRASPTMNRKVAATAQLPSASAQGRPHHPKALPAATAPSTSNARRATCSARCSGTRAPTVAGGASPNVWSASPTAASSPSASSPAHSAAAPATRAPPSVNAASVRVTVPARVRGAGVRNAPGDATSRTGFGPAQRGGRSPERAARRAPSTALPPPFPLPPSHFPRSSPSDERRRGKCTRPRGGHRRVVGARTPVRRSDRAGRWRGD